MREAAGRIPTILFIAGCLVGFASTSSLAGTPTSKIEFNRDIRPILVEKCFQCHGPDASHRKAGLRLDTEEGAKADLKSGNRAVVAGKLDKSELWARVTTGDVSERMPPKKSGKVLTKNEIESIRFWLEQGAAYQLHWSYAPLARPGVSAVASAWPRTPVDRFILDKLAAQKLHPSPEANKVTLVRRVYFDLIGLPPTPNQSDDFLNDRRPDAYEHLVDALLQSPRYGERMAMYWLDLVRYADTVGYHGDQEHHIWPYRDYVIKAFNDNMPFRQFTIEQLAGDLLPGPTVEQRIATGYNRVLQTTHEGGAQDKEYLAKYAADRVRNFSAVWMAATMGCAECHSHRYDPYTQKDFYRLAAFFADIDERGTFKGPDTTPTKRPPEIEVPAMPGTIDKGKRLTLVTVAVKPRITRVLKRGDWMDTTGEIVEPAAPQFMKPVDAKDRRATRLDLARWLTAPDHPQTARVFVNRLWYLFHGAGLARSLDDTGSQGEWPTHPELLDWLASEFVESGWNIKHVVKLLVTSSTYRQSSLEPEALRKIDPDNRLFARQARFRLPAEMIRDQALAVSGLLVNHLGGRSVKPYQPDGYYANLNFPKRTYIADKGAEQYRRAVYTHWQRTYLHPMLKAFDAPTREECTAQRPFSNTPQAALVLLNDPSFLECARVLAGRILREGGAEESDRIRWAWRHVLGRVPEDREAAALGRLYQASHRQYSDDLAGAEKLVSVGLAPRPSGFHVVKLAAWTTVARVLLNLNETITRN